MIGAFILRYHLTNDFFSIRIIDRNACTWILHFLPNIRYIFIYTLCGSYGMQLKH